MLYNRNLLENKLTRYLSYFQKNLGKKNHKDIQSHLNRWNLRISFFVSGIQIILGLLRLSYFYMPGSMISSLAVTKSESFYRKILFITYLVANILMFIYSILVFKKKIKSNSFTSYFLYLYIIICCGFSVYSAFLDCLVSHQIFIFITISIIIFTLFNINPIFLLVLSIVSFFTMYKLISSNSSTQSIVNSLNTFNYVLLFMAILFSSIIQSAERIYRLHSDRKLQQLNEDLKKFSFFDALTNLKNRHALSSDYSKYVNTPLIVMMSDVDDFKFYNDDFGHDIGDKILFEVAHALTSLFGENSCYRFGGDEFLLIATNLSESDFLETISRWRKKFTKKVSEELKLIPSCSCGYIYGTPKSESEIREMIQLADGKLYEAKARGKNCEIGTNYENAIVNKKVESLFIKKNYKKNEIDALTKLPNMMYFKNKARLILNHRKTGEGPMVLVYFDAVNFKTYNERNGFEKGDKLLKKMAETLTLVFPKSLIAHFSGDHFVLITERESIESKIEEVYKKIYSAYGKIINAGIYICNEQNPDITKIWDCAKIACDSAKKRYDQLYQFYDERLKQKLDKRQYLIEHIEEAIEKKWITVYYQPIIDVKTGNICDFEALSRWNDPIYGFISPEEFISVLEDSHLVQKIDLHIIEQICKNYSYCKENNLPIIPVSANISRIDFCNGNIVQTVDDVLQKYNMPRNLLSIEVTESAFIENQDILKEQVLNFREKGFKVWLDDFGSGYSSLNVMEEYGFDMIKIDMKFMKKFNTSEKIHIMLTHIISMSKELGMQTLAEGVENESNLDFLKQSGCEKAQGFLISKPLPFEEAMKWVADLSK